MKLCIDCKYFRRSIIDSFFGFIGLQDFSKCAKTASSLVDGNGDLNFCENERSVLGNCGIKGLNWEPKNSVTIHRFF